MTQNVLEKIEEFEEYIDEAFLADVVDGLGAEPKTLPCKYFYDEKGSLLFEDICLLGEYYITRTEMQMLQNYGEEIAELIGPQAVLIEPGSGAGEKVQLLLNLLDNPAVYIPIEISGEILQRSTQIIQNKHPELMVYPVEADFSAPLDIIASTIEEQVGGNRCLFFPGSTIGNFSPDQAVSLLQQFAKLIGDEGSMLVGVDRLKDRNTLVAAYDDALGVTADFNKNLLTRINNELGGDFSLDQFQHQARFNEEESRIEMHLISQQEQSIQIADNEFHFQSQESIHTENSYKYSDEVFAELVADSGLKIKKHWMDADKLFSLYLLTVDNTI